MSQSTSDEVDSDYNLSDPDAESFLDDIEKAIIDSDYNDSDDSNVKCITTSTRACTNVKCSLQ